MPGALVDARVDPRAIQAAIASRKQLSGASLRRVDSEPKLVQHSVGVLGCDCDGRDFGDGGEHLADRVSLAAHDGRIFFYAPGLKSPCCLHEVLLAFLEGL